MASTESLTDSKKPQKEGGWGWVVVFAAFMIYFLVFGSLRCQSVLFVPIMHEYNSDYFDVGWISAIATAGLAVSGILSAYLMSKIGHKLTVIIGGIVACLASVASVFAPSVAVLNVTAGLFTGLGLGISFVAAPVIIGFYFKEKRAFATNLASMGSSIGSFALCPLNGLLIDQYGLSGYYLILGGIFLHLSVAGSLMRPVSVSKAVNTDADSQTEQLKTFRGNDAKEDNEETMDYNQLDENRKEENRITPKKQWLTLVKNLPYIVYCLSQVIFLAGFMTSQLYIVPFAEKQIGVSKLQAPLVMSIIAGTELCSRIVFGILGDLKRVNRLLMFAGVLLFLSVCTFVIPFTNSFVTLSVAAGVMGLFQGGFSGISIVVLADIVGIKLYGTALGISTLLNGVGTLLAPPLIGIAVDQTNKPSVAIFISAGLLLVGALLTFAIKIAAQIQKRPIQNC